MRQQITFSAPTMPNGNFSQAIASEVRGRVRQQYFEYPASTMVEVTKMVKPDYLIEISAIAVIQD